MPISVQTGGTLDTVQRLAELLAWAHTLCDVTAEWWHTGDRRLHVTVTGLTTSGVRIQVYSGLAFDTLHGLVPLAAGESATVPLDELDTLVRSLRETHAQGTGDLTTRPAVA